MTSQAIQKLAKVLVSYSIRAQEKENIGIHSTPAATPLVEAVYEECLKVGAHPVIKMTPQRLTEIFYRHGKPVHFDEVSDMDKQYALKAHGLINIASSTNTRALNGVDPKKQARHMKSHRPLKDILLRKKWVITLFPTEAYAQDAEMSLGEFEQFVYQAAFADRDNPISEWKKLHRRQERLIRKLAGTEQVSIEGPDTSLTLSIKGRTFINSSGGHNMPSGELFTSPVESSVEGHIRYDYPVCVNGREIDGIRLVFRKGKVVEAHADKNNHYLQTMLDMDKGARYLGELGIGTNFGIQKFIKNILFDEKIGGTIHLALGQSFSESGGKNKSALHWDMIKDLRKGGSLSFDGKVFLEDGKFVN